MNKTHLRRSLAAVITTVACLAIMANPASATVVNAEITGGEITLAKTGVTEVIDLTPGTGGGTTTCPAGVLQVDVQASTINVTALSVTGVRPIGATNYLAVLTRLGSVAGTKSGGTITNMKLTVGAAIYSVPTTGCAVPTTPPLCRLAVQATLNGTYTGTLLNIGDTATLTGASNGTVVANPTCTAGPSFLLGTTLTVTQPLTAVVV